MSAFFGIDAHAASALSDKNFVCVDENLSDLCSVLLTMRAEDVVFVKDFTAQGGLQVEAVGLVQPGSACEKGAQLCMPVKWVWQGHKTIEELDEKFASGGLPLYEEHNITAQREIIDLAPELKLPDEW